MVCIHNGILPSKEKEQNWVILMMWMYLKSVIDSEVSQKEKNKYHGNIYKYTESRKMVLMSLFTGQE